MALINWKQLTGVPATATQQRQIEALTIATQNTVPDLSKTPITASEVILFVNGVANSSQETPAPFTVAGKVVTWSAANAGFNLETTDEVLADYLTAEA